MKPTDVLAKHAGHRAIIESATSLRCVDCTRRVENLPAGLPIVAAASAVPSTSKLRECVLHRTPKPCVRCAQRTPSERVHALAENARQALQNRQRQETHP